MNAAAATKPALYVFAISHFCEKGRWTLDHHKIDYELRFVGPGFHAATARKLGAAATTYPILVADGRAIQGSTEIVDWADAHGSGPSLTPTSARAECLAIEQRLGDLVGLHTRRLFYSEAMVEHPRTIKPIFTKDLDFVQRVVLSAGWPYVRKKMIESLHLGRAEGDESQRIIDGELGWLDGLLADGRSYLVGDRFSRADLSGAALLARMAAPKEHPGYAYLGMPPRLAEVQATWRDRPSLSWVREIYRRFR